MVGFASCKRADALVFSFATDFIIPVNKDYQKSIHDTDSVDLRSRIAMHNE